MNVCVARCNFCAFYRPVGVVRRSTSSVSTRSSGRSTRRSPSAEISCCCREATTPTCRSRGTRICSASVKARYPAFKLHALSPPEVLHISRLNQIPVPAVIERLIAAGLDSIPGGGAEILVDRVRKLLNCYGKASSDEWLGVMREAHLAGLRTTATMMMRDRRDRRRADRAHDAAARRAGRDRRLHRLHHVELPARAHRARRARKRPASTTSARSRCRASSSTTSTTCRRRG